MNYLIVKFQVCINISICNRRAVLPRVLLLIVGLVLEDEPLYDAETDLLPFTDASPLRNDLNDLNLPSEARRWKTVFDCDK